MFTVLNTLFLLAYLLSAMVQYNDPDPLAWIAIYLAAAGMCIVRFCKRLPKWLPALLTALSLVWIGILLPDIVGQVSLAEIAESVSMRTRAVEEGREIGGLLLVAIWAATLMSNWGRTA